MELKMGSEGKLVEELQTRLRRSGFDPGPVDGTLGEKTREAVVKFQESEKLEVHGVAGVETLKRLDIEAKARTIEPERAQFRELIMKNPNYFGNLKVSPYKPVKVIGGDTAYEEIRCIGYNPQFERLEAVVSVKKEYGYSGDVCSAGSPEYVRFYVDWNNDGNWVDVGLASFTAYDVPGNKPLEYAVTVELSPEEKFCTVEHLPRVRAVLSWNNPPPPDDPDFVPVWGNVKEARIQIDPLKLFVIGDLLKLAEVELPESLLASIDLSQPLQVLKQEVSLAELKNAYKDKGIPAHRFMLADVQKMLDKPALTAELKETGLTGVMAELDIDVAGMIDELLETDGDTRYEELRCVALNPNQDVLVATLTVKRPYGYSGDLCKEGSYEYVAFWEYDEIEQMWLYLGTALVNVHDIHGIPRDGLQYSVFLPVNLSRHRRPCFKGASVVKIRAIMSWNVPPPPHNPEWVPTWGNREEVLIHVKPGPAVGADEQVLYVESAGNMAVCDVDQGTGLATGTGIIAAFQANESPFGGVVTITGLITNPPNTMEGEKPLKYRVFVRPYEPGKSDAENPWQPLSNRFWVKVTEQTGSSLPVQKSVEQKIDSDGYYTYLEDLKGSAWRYVAGRVLARWATADSNGMWEIKVEAKAADGTLIKTGAVACLDGTTRSTVRLRLDNVRPKASITITGFQRNAVMHSASECGEFVVGDVIYGKYTATDKHFGALSLSVNPDPNPSLPAPAKPRPDPMGPTAYPAVPTNGVSDHDWKLDTEDMRACGYTVHLHVRDRTIVNSGHIGWHSNDYVGFCLKEAGEEKKKR